MDNLQSLVRSHQADFDRIYDYEKLGTRHFNFPLEEIDMLEWERGPYGNEVYAYFYRRFTAHILGLLQVKDGHRILNIGCGAGSEEKNLVNLYSELDLFSIDVSNSMILAAKKNNSPTNLSLAIAEQLPFPNQAFDRIVSREVIEHVISPAMMIQEVARCLKPGGLAVITTEFETSLGPGHLYSTFRRKILAPLFGIELAESPYENEAPTVEEFKSFVASSSLVLERIIWDGAMYLFCSSLFFRRVFKSRIASVAHFFSRLENEGSTDRFFCDQIKFVVRKPEESGAYNQETRATPDFVKKPEGRRAREYRGSRVRSLLFSYTDRILFPIFNAIVLLLGTLLVLCRSVLGRPRLYEILILDDRLRKYLTSSTIPLNLASQRIK